MKEDMMMMRVLVRLLAVTAMVAGTFAAVGSATAAPAGLQDGGMAPNAECGETKHAVVRGGGGTLVLGEAKWTVTCDPPGHIEAHGWVADQLTDGRDICVSRASMDGVIDRTQGSGGFENFWWREDDNDRQLDLVAHVC